MLNRFGMFNIISEIQKKPNAYSAIRGSEDFPNLYGKVQFHQTPLGVLVITEMFGLPTSADKCKSPIFAFHIHAGESCTGNSEDPFANALTHYNPNGCSHPFHAGDLPPLFGNNGYAFLAFITNRFSVKEIIGKTIIVHSSFDDFSTQPSGNAGEKIACGQIVAV